MRKSIFKTVTLALCLALSSATIAGCYSGEANSGNENSVPDQVDTTDRSG